MRTFLNILMLTVALSCSAKEVTVGSRIQFDYDDTQLQQQPINLPGASTLQLASIKGGITVVVMPERLITGGMSSAESRREFIQGLADTDIKTEDIKAGVFFGKNGYELVSKRETNGISLHLRIVLIIDESDILIVMSGSRDIDPMSVPTISAVWKSVRVLKSA